MTTAEIAQGVVELCRAGKFDEAVEKYYAADIVSVESMSMPGMPAEMKGIEAVRGKGEWWVQNHEIHGMEVNGPYVGGDQFAVQFKFDVTNKPSGQRMQMDEVGLYTVKGGKIVHEHFYYPTGS